MLNLQFLWNMAKLPLSSNWDLSRYLFGRINLGYRNGVGVEYKFFFESVLVKFEFRENSLEDENEV